MLRLRKEFTATIKSSVYEKYKGKCNICKKKGFTEGCWSHTPSFKRRTFYLCGLEIHHIIPCAQGGTNDISNLTLLCPTCHKKAHNWKPKRSKYEDAFYPILSR